MPGVSSQRARQKRLNEAERSDKAAAEAPKAEKRQKKSDGAKKNSDKAMYLVTAKEYGAYREDDDHTIGLYSTKKLALENARVAFEQQFSNDFFQEGAFTEPEIFETAEDNSKTIGDEGIIYEQCDQEGEGARITLEKIVVDKPYEPK